MTRILLPVIFIGLQACAQTPLSGDQSENSQTVADTHSQATTAAGEFISWREHLIDTQAINGGVPIRGGDGLAMADLDNDGFEDIVSVHEDSNHLRIAFGTDDPDRWDLVTVASGPDVAAIEDVAIGDLNGDGWLDLVAACEEAHLLYLENPGRDLRKAAWPSLIPEITQGRGSWLRAFIADMNGDGRMDVLAPNKGSADIIDPTSGRRSPLPTALFTLSGDPRLQSSWNEQILSKEVVPNTAMPVDIDDDGDLDVLAAARLEETMTILEVVAQDGIKVDVVSHPIAIEPGFDVPESYQIRSSAFQSVFADLNHDGRKDLLVGVTEPAMHNGRSIRLPALGWLRQPSSLDQAWTYFRIGDTLPDAVVGLALADLDGDGDLDAVSGGYSGLNIVDGGYSGAPRDRDGPRVTAASTVGRMTWFENTGNPQTGWVRHDISRRVRDMNDGFIARDLDQDGDLDLISTRGNSGDNDGVFWLEQIRTQDPVRAFTPASKTDSRALPLPPLNWLDLYDADIEYVAPNKVGGG